MIKQTVFKKVMVTARLPSVSAVYDTEYGRLEFDNFQQRWYDLDDNILLPSWWLEEIELPSEEEIREAIEELPYNEDMSPNDLGVQGANYILNKLK